MLLASQMKPLSLCDHSRCRLYLCRLRPKMKPYSVSPVMRLFRAGTFEASKLKVVVLGLEEVGHLPRTYTLTHNDITAMLTLTISHSINNSQLQGWTNKLYRDEVVGEWKKVKGKMSLHVHCHISGGHFLFDLCAPLRYSIFCKELPVVLKAFVHGDEKLINCSPELQEALVWVHFHSTIPEFDKVECWGPLHRNNHRCQLWALEVPRPCSEPCKCCSGLIPWSQMNAEDHIHPNN